MDKATLTVPEAGRLLGLSRGGAYELARRGELPGVIRLGKRLVVSKAALERLLGAPISGERPGEGAA